MKAVAVPRITPEGAQRLLDAAGRTGLARRSLPSGKASEYRIHEPLVITTQEVGG